MKPEKMFHRLLSPTGRWEEKCLAKMKYQSYTRVIYNTRLQWELFLAVFFKVSQEITTSLCECLCKGVIWDGCKPSLSLVLLQRCCSRTSSESTDSGFTSSLFPTDLSPLLQSAYNRGWQQMLVRQNDMQHGVWIRAKPATHPCMRLGHLIYSALFSPVLTLYISFDLLTLMVSLKISSSISSAILKPLILPERERERGGGRKLVLSVMFIWHFPLVRDSVGCDCEQNTWVASRGSPKAGYRALFTWCCIPASSLTQEPVMTKYPTGIRVNIWSHSWSLFPRICILCGYLFWMHSCASVLFIVRENALWILS